MPSPRPFVLGLTGLSSTGKTTLSQHLRRLFPAVSLIHQDDFYHADSLIPTHSGLQDWDCAASIDWPSLTAALSQAPDAAAVATNTDAVDLVAPEFMRRMETRVRSSAVDETTPLVIVDGFLLVHGDSAVEALLDATILLRVPYAVVSDFSGYRREGGLLRGL